MAAVAAGEAIPHIWNISMYDFACNGGCGCTLGLVIVMALFAKSQRYKQFSKLVLPCGIFNINEPVVFGMPLMYNFNFREIVEPTGATFVAVPSRMADNDPQKQENEKSEGEVKDNMAAAGSPSRRSSMARATSISS